MAKIEAEKQKAREVIRKRKQEARNREILKELEKDPNILIK